MTKEELLQPRYKLITTYPGCDNDLGTIFKFEGYVSVAVELWQKSFNKYPHLFRPLSWWEERSVTEMPQYLRFLDTGKVRKVKQYSNNRIEFEGGRVRNFSQNWQWQPATETEYLEYINKQNK